MGFHCKMSFNPDLNRQAIKVCWPSKREKENSPRLQFNSTDVELRFILDSELNFNPIQDGLFKGCSRMKGAFFEPLPKIRQTYPIMLKLGTVIPYQRKIKKM